MKKFCKHLLLFLLVVGIVILVFIFADRITPLLNNNPQLTGEVMTGIDVELSGTVDTWEVVPEIVTGSTSVIFDPQPTELPGNYQENGDMLRAWAENNTKVLYIPIEAKNVRIWFVFTKISHYDNIPWNLQLSVGRIHLCNGRLSNKTATIDLDTNTYRYDLNNISTQDKPEWVDASLAIGKTLTVKAWVWENGNRIESIIVEWVF
jgi:hypothetical protein